MLSVPGPAKEDFLQEKNPKQVLEKRLFFWNFHVTYQRDCKFGSDEMFPAPSRRRSITDWK